MHRIKLIFIVFLLISAPVLAKDAVGLEQFEPLVGSWKLKTPATEKDEAFRLRYRWISRGTVLVETWGDPLADTTQTLYHRAGDKLMATHYCARGNQPRLLATQAKDANVLEFEFHDITNLVDDRDPHMVAMSFRLIDDQHLEKSETYLVKGERHTSVMLMIREAD